jgi:hypothetical protein
MFLLLASVAAFSPCDAFAQAEPDEDGGPLLFSVFPTTGQPGSTVEAVARGVRLDGARTVWFDGGGFKSRILNVEEVKDPVKPRVNPLERLKITGPFYRVLIELQIGVTTRSGVHLLRLVSAHGVSNPIGFSVVDAPVTLEVPGSHQTIEQSQPVVLPGLISGKIGEPGEVDTYSFSVRKGQELRFEAVEMQKFDAAATAGKFATELALCRAGGSWFDPHRPAHLLFEGQGSSDLMRQNAEGTYRFSDDGQYYLQISGLFGQGCPDCTYQVQVVSSPQLSGQVSRSEAPFSEWTERSFSRNLKDNWMARVEARSVKDPEATPGQQAASTPASGVPAAAVREVKQPVATSHPLSAAKREANERAAQVESLLVPAVIEGTIEHPGNVDNFKFKVESGQKLAFEIEASDTKPPYFNPRIGITDSQDRELFSNVERRLSMFNNNANPQVYLKNVQPKAIYNFDRGGEYTLQVRDITSRYGNPSYQYRILVRPAIPHVGEILVLAKDRPYEVAPSAPKPSGINRINLSRREPKKLILLASYEEGFVGDGLSNRGYRCRPGCIVVCTRRCTIGSCFVVHRVEVCRNDEQAARGRRPPLVADHVDARAAAHWKRHSTYRATSGGKPFFGDG